MHNSTTLSLTLRIDWSELDLFGHVNNVMFYRYIQSARVTFWERIDLYRRLDEEGVGPLLVSATIDFKRPLLYPGNVHIHFKTGFIKTTSFGLEYELLNDNDELCAVGKDAMVLYDFKRNEKITIPDELREMMESYLSVP